MFNNNVLAIDIGQAKIKIVHGKQSKNTVKILDSFTVDTPIAAFNNGYILKIKEIAKIIRYAIDERNIKTKKAILTLASTDIIKRQLILPKIKKRELASMVEFEIQQYLPIAVEDYVIEYKILEDIMEDNIKKSKIQVAVLPKEIAKVYYDLVNELGLEPVALDACDNAISKIITCDSIINDELTIKDKTVALIDLGSSSMNLSIISNGIPSFSRLIPHGSRDLSANVANVSSLTVMDAEETVFNSMALTDINDDFIQEVVKSKIDEWMEDIRRVFQYYTSRESGNKIDEIYLYGGISDYQVFIDVLQENLGVDVNKILELNNIRFIKEHKCDISKYLNAVGSIIRR